MMAMQCYGRRLLIVALVFFILFRSSLLPTPQSSIITSTTTAAAILGSSSANVNITRLDLAALTKSRPKTVCNEGAWVDNNVLPVVHVAAAIHTTTSPSVNSIINNVIPGVVHQTSRSRCIPQRIADAAASWRHVPGYSYYLHDEGAVRRLLQQDWPEFPNAKSILPCLESNMEAVLHVWQYLLLWEYGGVYVDMDWALLPASTGGDKPAVPVVSPTDDAVVFLDSNQQPSHSFIAISPKHPLAYYAIHLCLYKAAELTDTGRVHPDRTSGTNVWMMAMRWFTMDGEAPLLHNNVTPGIHVGKDGRSVRVVEGGRGVRKHATVGKNWWNADTTSKPPHSSAKSCLATLFDSMQQLVPSFAQTARILESGSRSSSSSSGSSSSTTMYALMKRHDGCTGMFWRSHPSGSPKMASNDNWPRDGAQIKGSLVVYQGANWVHASHVRQLGEEDWTVAPENAYIPFEYNDHYYLQAIYR